MRSSLRRFTFPFITAPETLPDIRVIHNKFSHSSFVTLTATPHNFRLKELLTLGTPAEVARVESERAVLHVAAPAPHRVHTLVTKLGHRRRAPHLELPLLPVLGALTARFTTLVTRIPRDTCMTQCDKPMVIGMGKTQFHSNEQVPNQTYQHLLVISSQGTLLRRTRVL